MDSTKGTGIRFNAFSYKQRSFLILLPLLLLAGTTWALNPYVSPEISDDLRKILLLSARIFFPGLFAIAVAFVVPTFDRCFQITMVALIYMVAIICVPSHSLAILMNPVICVVTAVSSLFAMLPYPSTLDGSLFHNTRRLIITIFFVSVLPVATFLSVILILRQMDLYILYTFDETFGENIMAVVYVPIYLIMQTLGFHDALGELILLSHANPMTAALVNTIIVIDLFSLPATIFMRSVFTKGHVRFFLTLLAVICILTNSIGACVSLTLLLLLIFYPGSFITLLSSSMVCFALSYFLEAPAITEVSNLFLPDVNLAFTKMLLLSKDNATIIVELFAIAVPCIIILLATTSS